MMVVAIETLIIYKHSENTANLVDTPTPYWISIPWSSILIFSICFYIYLIWKKDATTEFP